MTRKQRLEKLFNRGYGARDISSITAMPQHKVERELFRLTNNTKYLQQAQLSKKRDFVDLQRRLDQFTDGTDNKISVADVIAKFGEETQCYLTGHPINLRDPQSFQVDHIIPISREGARNLDNLGLLAPIINRVKTNLTPEELIRVCRKILQHTGGKADTGKARKRGAVKNHALLRRQGVPTIGSLAQ